MRDTPPNEWTVQLQSSTGDLTEYAFKAHWDKDREGINERVAEAAAIQAWYETDKKIEYQPIAVL